MSKINILVSECLLGVDCTYKNSNNKNQDVINLGKKYNLIPICPEQLGGMTTPRVPSENYGDKIVNKQGEDVTMQFEKGANISLYLAKMYGCKYAVLKAKSPSCGFGKIYDGTFTGTLISGNGTTADLLFKNGIKVFNENQTELLINEIENKKISD